MCTTLVLSGPPGHLLLLSNRDELRTRAPAIPPTEPPADGPPALFPVDADALGTWAGVNAHGLALSLLNNYQADAVHAPELPTLSRGILTRDLLDARDLDEVASRVQARPDLLARVRPFVLTAAQAPPSSPARAILVTWNGAELSHSSAPLPLLQISSGFDLRGVTASRAAEVAPLQTSPWSGDLDDALDLSAAFGSPHTLPDAYTLFMRRDDARTVSHTLIAVTPDAAHLVYRGVPDGDALAHAPAHHLSLDRPR
jgi:hypothetical protein